MNTGQEIYQLCVELFPICRSITGHGVRETLAIIKRHLPELTINEVPTGTQAFDWTVPNEWNINEAYIIDPNGQRIIDFKDNNLHVVGYSTAINKSISLDELQAHLYSLPEQPDAIPYITSYYQERWGFCLTHEQRETLKPGNYQVFIDSSHKKGSLTYGELILPGQTSEEIFLSTYICHPSMANNELSGPTVTTYLAKWLLRQKNRRYSYRIIFIPETIGSIVYLSRNLDAMKEKVVAGFNINCIGDDRAYSYLASRYGNTLADQVARHVLKHLHPNFIAYSYLDRASDERQYCSPGVDLPVATIMRTKYGSYPEYHTSLDNLDLITPSGLNGGYEVLEYCLKCLERNETLKTTILCEPQLGKRGLYPTLSTKNSKQIVRDMMDLIAYCDGTHDLLTIAEIIDVPMWNIIGIVDQLKYHQILKSVSEL
jgi:aminopeptidase-like protein